MRAQVLFEMLVSLLMAALFSMLLIGMFYSFDSSSAGALARISATAAYSGNIIASMTGQQTGIVVR